MVVRSLEEIARSDVKRLESRRAWDRKHLRTVSTKLTVEENRRLLALCKAEGVTRYALLAELIRGALRWTS